MILLISLLTLPASAALMCGLTQADVEDVLGYYGSSLTYQDVAPYVTAPFACFKYGNLCDIVGGSRAPTYVCNVWADAVAHQPTATITADADAELESMATAWEAELYPTGIPDSDPWWGVAPPPSGCGSPVFLTNSAGTHRIRVKAFWVVTGVYNYIGASTKGYDGSAGSWTKGPDGDVVISPTFVRLDLTGGECRYPYTKSDSDGFVRKIEWGIFTWPSKHVEATGSYYGMSADVCKTAPWLDPGC